jgi:cytosine/adenosine deaminase-related metal-dependent hydrolase
VIAYRKTRTPEQVDADIQAGIAECLRHGTTLIADISLDGRSFELLASHPLTSVVCHEIRGLRRDRARKAFLKAQEWLRNAPRSSNCDLKPGLSPHAPYSVSYQELDAIFKFSRKHKPSTVPLVIHLAETPEEIELLEHHSGPFVPFLQELGVWEPSQLAPSIQHIIDLTRSRWSELRILFIHCNFLSPTAQLPSASTIVYCPRTHAAFGHSAHPFRDFLKRGIRVALGTDSLASNPDLSVLSEARYIARNYPDFDRAALLRMITLSAADGIEGYLGLSWGDMTASLLPGKSADFAVVPLPDRDDADPHELLFNSDLPVQSTWIRGERVFNLDSAT